MIEKMMKALYILTIAIIVFLGGLLITQGMSVPRAQMAEIEEAVSSVPQSPFEFQEGNTL